MNGLPRWAQALKDRHPNDEMPTRDNPIPEWLQQEVAQTPLWYIIREAAEPRTQHPYVLLDEIRRQPNQWAEILGSKGLEVDRLVDIIVDGGVEQVIFTGCGSAFFTAIHGAFTFQRLTGIRAEAIESFELTHYFPSVDPARTLVVAHSGTGGSIETIEAVRAAAARGCLTLAITNTQGSSVASAARHSITYETRQACGPCISVISTRILLQTMLALAVAASRGVESSQEVVATLPGVVDAGRAFLNLHESTIWELAKRHCSAESFMLVGSGPNYFSAREGTLKIEEQAILVAKAYRTGDFHHDALSLVAPARVVIGIEAAGSANERVVDALRAAREGESPTIAVTWSGGAGVSDLAQVADAQIAIAGGLPEIIAPIPMTLVFQLLGYYLGVERGFNPDTLRTDHLPNARAWLTSFPLGTH